MKLRFFIVLVWVALGGACTGGGEDVRCASPGTYVAEATEVDLCARIVGTFSWESMGSLREDLDCRAGCELDMAMQGAGGGAELDLRGPWEPALTLFAADLHEPDERERVLLTLRDRDGRDSHGGEDLAWLARSLGQPQSHYVTRVGNHYVELKFQSIAPE